MVQSKPSVSAPKQERLNYALKIAMVSLGAMTCLVGAGIGSIIILRQAKKGYQNAVTENLTDLITGTQKDISEKKAHGDNG